MGLVGRLINEAHSTVVCTLAEYNAKQVYGKPGYKMVGKLLDFR
jgi:hypothetical protein